MGRPVFGFPIYSDYTGTGVSGGSWLNTATVKLANVLDPRLAVVARSTNATTGATQFTVNLGTPRPIGIIAIPAHSISASGKVRVTASGYDSGWVDVNPVIYPAGVLPSWHPSYTTRKLTVEEYATYRVGFTLVPTTPVTAQSWTIAIDDTTNPAGYVDVGRIVLAAGWTPTLGIQKGHQLDFLTSTTSTEVDGGAEYFNTRPVRRRQQFTLNLPVDEALSFPFEMMRKLGTSGQLYFVFDATDVEHLVRRSFLATLRKLGTIEWPYAASKRNAAAFEVVEVL